MAEAIKYSSHPSRGILRVHFCTVQLRTHLPVVGAGGGERDGSSGIVSDLFGGTVAVH